jgi:fructose-1,6-bisphosphatase/inositol monophosphatase family enzyme
MNTDLHTSIFRVTSADDDNKRFGTGFAVHRDEQATYFVTCMHVITNDKGELGQIKVGGYPATVVAHGVEHDLYDIALLRVENLVNIPSLKLSTSGQPGESCFIIGFQESNPLYVLRPLSGNLGASLEIEATQQSGRAKAWDLKIKDDFSLQKGYSGAPVVRDSTGEVIGIVSHRLGEGKLGRAISAEALIRIWPHMAFDLFKPTPTQLPVSRSLHLCERINEDMWEILQQAVIHAATAGGMEAMSYYRLPINEQADFPGQDKENKNPSTIADMQATSAMLHTLDLHLSPIARKLGCSLMFLGEETKYQSWFERNLDKRIFERIHSSESFFIDQDNSLRVIIDGIDGTGSFTRGIPLFCSALAILVGNQPRASAIYDPFHNVVYFAVLTGPYENPTAYGKAIAWEVATGNRIDLTQMAKKVSENPRELKKEAIDIHLSRTQRHKLHEFLEIPPSQSSSMLERLALRCGATYAYNCGVVAMADVARGALGAFVTNVTNLWDVAAGEVLVSACRGTVTDFDGRPISYSTFNNPSVVAAKKHLHPLILDILKSD